ncbi:tachykinin-3 isoform X3 [Pogona vitticeps]
MKSPLVLMVVLSLLVAELCHGYCVASQEQQMPSGIQTKQKSSDLYKLPPSLLRRLYDGQGISYEALLRLSGKEEIDPQALAPSQKRDMHDFFVGLMGKRTTESENPIEDNKGTLTAFGDLKFPPNAE